MENTENENGLIYEMGDREMTIEYLRARLLSERSVSKSAKQRADELAERVVELEEQLKVVHLQRKKTQKATLDVIGILGSLGISDDSEGYDLSSDQESTHPQSCNGNCLEKNTDKSISMDQNGFEPTTYSCRSLSWNTSRCSSHSERKSASSRRRSSFLSSDISSPSPKHQVGKSCRQIKCKEMRSTADGELSENEAKSESQIAGDGEMERALERRAELINRFEAEENAQIEWEEKYKEPNSSTPDSVEPGSQSDVTEERDELRSQPAIFQHVNEDASAKVRDARTDEVCRIFSNEDNVQRQPSPQTTVQPQKSENGNSGTCRRSHTSYPDDTVPINEAEKTQDKLKGYISSSSKKAATNAKYCKGEVSKDAVRKSVSVSLEASNDLGSILEELQRAKLTLQHKLRKLPEDGFIVKARESHHVPVRAQMPASCAGLFWVPTDPQAEENIGKSYLNSRSHSRSKDHNHASTFIGSLTDNIKLKSQEGITMSNASDGISFDFANKTKTALSSLWNGDDYTRSPSVLSERGFSNSDRYKLSPQFGTPRSSFTGSDRYMQSPLPDFHFGFLTNNSDGSRSPLANNLSSPSSNERREFKLQPENSMSSPVHKDQFPKNIYNSSSSAQFLFNSISGSSQPLSAEPYYSRGPDISPSSNHRLVYSPSQQSIHEINKPATPTFRGFPSLPSSTGSARDLTSRKLGT